MISMVLVFDDAVSDHYVFFFESYLSVYNIVQTEVISKRYIT